MEKDPYRYFRIEAREILEELGRGALELEAGSGGGEIVVRLLRQAHTLKGASRVVKQVGIAELAHALEEVLLPYREAGHPFPTARIDDLLAIIDGIRTGVGALDPKAAPSWAESSESVSEPFETVRVELAEMDTLLEGISEVSVQLAALGQAIEGVERAHRLATAIADQLNPRPGWDAEGLRESLSLGKTRSIAEELHTMLKRTLRTLSVSVERTEREVAQVRDTAVQLRLLPASMVFASLERGARDAAQVVKKQIEFQTSGGEIRLDTHVLAALRGALLHVVRNAVAHGIESEGERVAAGKPPVGRVRLDVERRGHRIAFVCSDDGRGVDAEAVRRAAVGRKVISAAEAALLSREEAVRLILRGGVTTTPVATEISGRGVGLDVLRSAVARLKGEIRLKTEPGKGTTLEVWVPVSLWSMAALVVDAGGITASVPLDAVHCTLRVADQDVARSEGTDSIVCEGLVIPFLPLARALGKPSSVRTKSWSAVVIKVGAHVCAVGVDRLHGTSNVVVRSMPALVGPVLVVAGTSLDAEGNPQLVLDPAGLVAAAHALEGVGPLPVPARQAPVLVVDDSLTTRMLEQSILESAGYEVDLATSAEEGLVKARQRHYGIFIVDVEMPGMNGFEFVEQTRSDPILRDIPAILVTSRAAAEDRRRGEQAGAGAYIVKSEFEQEHLLRTIRRLIGQGAHDQN